MFLFLCPSEKNYHWKFLGHSLPEKEDILRGYEIFNPESPNLVFLALLKMLHEKKSVSCQRCYTVHMLWILAYFSLASPYGNSYTWQRTSACWLHGAIKFLSEKTSVLLMLLLLSDIFRPASPAESSHKEETVCCFRPLR